MNKTVYITFDEATRLVDACKDAGGNITKEFFDWYLGDGRFFAKTGILVIDNLPIEKERVAVSFDFSDPETSRFVSYRYSDQKPICRFSFKRQDNLTISDVKVEIEEFSPEVFQTGQIWFSPEVKERFIKISDDVARLERKRRMQKIRKTKTALLVEMAMKSAYVEINRFNCSAFVYYSYALMFSALKKEPEEVMPSLSGQLDVDSEKVSAIYRYSGYVNLNEKIYRPAVKKDPDEPVREYQRHIQKWTVRGHYRRTAKGLIWVGEHIKGEGEIEGRVYGTVDESEVPVVPKYFEVLRKKKNNKVGNSQNKSFIDRVIGFFFGWFVLKKAQSKAAEQT